MVRSPLRNGGEQRLASSCKSMLGAGDGRDVSGARRRPSATISLAGSDMHSAPSSMMARTVRQAALRARPAIPLTGLAVVFQFRVREFVSLLQYCADSRNRLLIARRDREMVRARAVSSALRATVLASFCGVPVDPLCVRVRVRVRVGLSAAPRTGRADRERARLRPAGSDGGGRGGGAGAEA